MGIGVAVEEAIDLLLATFVSDKSAALSAALVPLAVSGVTIQLMFIGRAMIAGELKEPVLDLIWRIAGISFIISLALGTGVYQSDVVETANEVERGMIVTVSGATSVGMLVDDLARPYADLGQQLWNRAVTGFWPNFALLAAAGGVAIIQVALFVVGLGLYLLAKVGLALVLAVGPAFILCAIWSPTQKYAESWLGQALNFVVLKVLIALSIQMLNDFASTFATHIDASMDAVNVIKAVIALFCCGGALFVVMLNLPMLASALVGGGSISGIGRSVAHAMLHRAYSSRSTSRPPSFGGQIQNSRTRSAAQPHAAPRIPLFQRNTMDQLKSSTPRSTS